jgi:hypothetical protein
LRSLAILLGLVVLAGLAIHFELPVPACPLRTHTGVPCPFCGSTRAFAALARLDWATAVQFNPLVSVAACVAGALWLRAAVRGKPPCHLLRIQLARSSLWKWLLALALALNWLYLWHHLPH